MYWLPSQNVGHLQYQKYICFSVGVGFGVLMAFGSYIERDSPTFNLSIIIAVCYSLFYYSLRASLILQFVGYLAHLEGRRDG